jgi:tetratricopeptide (TPR) repeat protein
MPLSVKFAELSLRAATDAIPGDPTDISIAYNNFAYVRKMMRNYREAQKMYECALRYAPRTTPQERFRAALMEANMGEAYVLGGNYDKAIVAYQRSLQVLKVLLPARHPALGELQQKIDALKGRAHVHRRKV